MHRPHVVVVGGGFAGLSAVRQLRGTDVKITLIDRHAYNTFQPLLYQVATASVNPGDITWFLRRVHAHQANVRFLKGAVTAVDPDHTRVQLNTGAEVTYDHLIIAVGATTNFFGVPGAREHAFPLYRRSQALRIRDEMFTQLEQAAEHGYASDLP